MSAQPPTLTLTLGLKHDHLQRVHHGEADKIRPSPGRRTSDRDEKQRELPIGISAAHHAFLGKSPRSTPTR
jgi:hypothetical protein